MAILNTSGGGRGRDEIRRTSKGFLSETFPAQCSGGLVTVASQRIYGGGIGLAAGDVVTNIHVGVAVAGTSTAPTTIRLGLATSAGVIVATTADLHASANWTETGIPTSALTVPGAYTVPSDGLYYPCFLQNGSWAGTAMQLFMATALGVSVALTLGSNPTAMFQWSSQSDLPAVGASLTFQATGSPVWFGVS